jgi:hypothetical protein
LGEFGHVSVSKGNKGRRSRLRSQETTIYLGPYSRRRIVKDGTLSPALLVNGGVLGGAWDHR